MNNLAPVIIRNYIKEIVRDLQDYLKANLRGDDYKHLIKSIKGDYSEEYKIACLIILPICSGLRKDCCTMLASYPLIRSKIMQLGSDVFRSKKALLEEINRYERRIKWNIQRFYRMRNSIIHSRDENENTKVLVEHLHCYVDIILNEIVYRIIDDRSNLLSIDSVLMDSQVFLDSIKTDYNRNEPLSEIDIKRLLG